MLAVFVTGLQEGKADYMSEESDNLLHIATTYGGSRLLEIQEEEAKQPWEEEAREEQLEQQEHWTEAMRKKKRKKKKNKAAGQRKVCSQNALILHQPQLPCIA
jgi:hypothetical protein